MEPGPEPSLAAEQFECGVCCKQLVGPKLLPCLHSACRECLRNEWAGQSSAPCPVCCAPTDGDVANLQDNMMVDNLVSQLELSRRIGLGSDIWCSVCQACGDKQPATSLCFQCDHFLCPRCCHSHQVLMERYGHLARTLDHLRMLRCEDFVTLARDEKQTICPDHKEQYIRFFCKTCSTSSCCNCLLLHHISADHRYHDIKQEAVLKKEELKQMVDATQENHNTFTEIYTGLKSLMGNLDCVRNDTETLIKQKASAMIEVINKQGDALLRELETEHNTEHSRLTQSLDQTQQIIKRMGAGKELAGIMLKFGTSEEMMEMYNTIQSALTALVGETPNDVSNGATLIKFLQCTLEAHNLLGTFILKKEQSEGAEDSEVEEALLAKLSHHHQERTSTREGPAHLQTLPAGSFHSAGPGPSGPDSHTAPFTRVEGQVEWAGEGEERWWQPVSPGPGSSLRGQRLSGPSFRRELAQKHKKAPEKRRAKSSRSVEDKNTTDVRKQCRHSEHNYSVQSSSGITPDSKSEILSWSSTEETTLNISTDLSDEDPWQLPAEETIKILSEESDDNGVTCMHIMLNEMHNGASSAAMTNESILSPLGHMGHNKSNWSSGEQWRDKATVIQLCQGGNPLVFFQLQTTGMGKDCEIVQVAAVSGERIFVKYILPNRPILAGAAAINGLQVMDGVLCLREVPQPTCSLAEAMAAFLQFLQSLDRPLLAGHNIWVRDCQIVYKAWGDLFMKDQFARCVTGFLDTLWLAREIVPRSEVKNYRLNHLVSAYVGEFCPADGALDNVRALQELYSALKPTPEHTQSSRFSLAQLECRMSLQPLFDQDVISRLDTDQLAFEEIGLNTLQLAHLSNPRSGLRNLVSAGGNLRLTNPQQVIDKIRFFLQLHKPRGSRHRSVIQGLKLEAK
uniref:protein PML-like isoform X1 n=1 Tax=Pristiophorus japonicus TaxID=55135 RepID=UPI00398F5845